MSLRKGIGFCQQSEVLRNMSTQNHRKRILSYLLYLLVKPFAIALTISSFLCFSVNTEGTNL